MQIDAIDHVVVACGQIDAATAPFERLGLSLTPPTPQPDKATENRALFLPAGAAGETYIEFLASTDPSRTARTGGGLSLLAAVERQAGLFRVALRVADIDAAAAHLAAQGVTAPRETVHRADGTPILDVLRPHQAPALGCEVTLVAYPEPIEARVRRHRGSGQHVHALPLKRLDHLAAVPEDLDAACAAWERLLRVPVSGEVRGSGMIIRQLRMGDAVLELLGAETPDSPIASRPKGAVSVVAIEVGNLDEAVRRVRAAGFTAPDPAPGILPGTRVATIPPGELSGLAFQMLEYV
jgi:catechol 2,3-dioxygenase-like lactoylglutathione lyase family enzyme